MKSIISFFIRRSRITNLLLILIILMGVLSAVSLRRQGYPAIDFDIMKISTLYPGASSEDVEINVTDVIEDELMEVEDIDEIKSLSMENISMIFVYMNPNATDSRKVVSDIRDAVDRVTDLPKQVTEKPKVEEIRSTNLPVLEIALTGDVSEHDLRKYAKDLEVDLKEATGVGIIEKVGYRKREIHVQADMDLLSEKYVSLSEIMNSIRSRNVRATGGTLESYVSEKKVVTFSEYEKPLDVKDVIIRSTFSGQRVRISDVASVADSFKDEDVLSHANGEPGISLLVRSQANADIITLADDIKERVERFRQGLPSTVKVHVLFDNSIYTRSLLHMVTVNGLMGFVLVILVMFLFLDWKTAFWTAFGLPLAICGAIILFDPFGITIDVITLSAMILVLGILVDDAIVVAENIYRLKESGMNPIEATIQGVRSIFWPVTAAVLTTMIAFLPMLYMKGLTGKFIVGIPIVVILMLGFSLIESTCFLPNHLAKIIPPKEPPKRTKWIQPVMEFYRKKVEWSLKNRAKVLSVFVGLFFLIILASQFWLKFVLFPQENPDVFNVIIEAPQGTSLSKTEQKIREIEKIVDEIVPDEMMQSYITRVGHHDTDVYGGSAGQYTNWALITVYLLPAEDRDEASEPVIENIRKRLRTLSGFVRLTVEPMDDGPPVGKPVTVIYTSDNDDLRGQFESETVAYLRSIDGVYGIESTNIPGKDELRLLLNYDEMAKLGITAVDVSRTVRAAFDGEVVTSIRQEGEEIDYRVRLKDPKKYRAEGVLDLLIMNNSGKLISLKHFANFKETRGPAVLHHYNGDRSVTVTAELDPKKITSGEVNAAIQGKFEPMALKHAGLKMELGGEEKKTKESFQSFYYALGVALVAIYFLLVMVFDSFGQPILIMTAIPFALIGVFLTFMIHGLPLGFIAMIGILGLVGVVVNDNIVMISHLNEMCADHGKSLASIAKGSLNRFRPVVLTTLSTVAGLIPTAYGIGGDLPFIRPMVLALAWGLLFATVITLIFTPVLYSLYERAK